MDRHLVLPRTTMPAGLKRLPFSDAVRTGDTLAISGRIGIDPATLRPPTDAAAEARLVMDDLRRVLGAAGMTTDDLVMVTIFAPDVGNFATFNAVYLEYFGEALPARAFIGSGPLLFGAHFELTALAVAGGAEPAPAFATVDLVDLHQGRVQSCALPLRQFGARSRCSGRLRTVLTYEDNARLRELLGTPGDGAVLVVDGGGSLQAALVGDQLAALALQNGWGGLIVNGAVRDVARLRAMPIALKALGSNPMKSTKLGTGDVDVPVVFGGVRFTPGAMLYSDDDGILVSELPLTG
jgi:regulator of ribonuclease activity A